MATSKLSVRTDDELIEVLGATAKALGVSRNALARRALEGIVDPKSLASLRERRRFERVRANIAEEERSLRECLDIGARKQGDSDASREADGERLVELDDVIDRFTTIINGGFDDRTKLEAVNARRRARDEKIKIMLMIGTLPSQAA